MPVRGAALRAAGTDYEVHNNSIQLAKPHLAALVDRWAAPHWVPLANVYSVGDVLIAARHDRRDRRRDAGEAGPRRTASADGGALHRLSDAARDLLLGDVAARATIPSPGLREVSETSLTPHRP